MAPTWRQFDMMKLSPDILPMMTIVDVEPQPLDFVYRFWGTGLVYLINEEHTGRKVTELRPVDRAVIYFAELAMVHETGLPKAFTHNQRTVDLSMPLATVTLRLPLSEDGGTVDKIVSYSSFERSSMEDVA